MADNNINNGLITKIWGPSMWITLHSITFGYPIEPTPEKKEEYKNFFECVGNVIPCKYCRESYKKFIKESDTNLEDFLDSRDSLAKWLYLIHNKVNDKLGVKYDITFDDVKKKYDSFRAQCGNSDSKGCIVPLYKKKAYKNYYDKDAPVIDLNVAKKFKNYAIQRGFGKEYYKLSKKLLKNKNNNKLWNKRNKYCCNKIKKMRQNIIPSIELEGKYKGKPTKDELKLIFMLSSNLSENELQNINFD